VTYYCSSTLLSHPLCLSSFFLTATTPTPLYTLSLHDALPISSTNGKIYTGWNGCATTKRSGCFKFCCNSEGIIPEVLDPIIASRSEEHTSELQSRFDLVCRLLLEKKKKKKHIILSDRPQQ